MARVRERLSSRKQKTDVERFNLKKLNGMEIRKEYQIAMSNRFTALENLNGSEENKYA
jgi:hypothetical protein